MAELPVARVKKQLGAGASDIAPLVSELRKRFPDLPEPDAVESAQARFRLFDTVSILLHNAGLELGFGARPGGLASRRRVDRHRGTLV